MPILGTADQDSSNRKDLIKIRWSTFLTLVSLLVGSAAYSQTAPELEYDAVAPLRLPPGLYLGEAAGVAVNSHGHIFVYSRTGSEATLIGPRAASLYEFAPDGTFVREIGGNLYLKAWAHAVRIDSKDNIWLVDNGSSMAAKLSPSGRVLQVFGRRPESTHARYPRCQGPHCPPHSLRPPYYETADTPPPAARDGLFDEVTDVAFDPDGNVYFSDGYNNARVAKYDTDGNWITSWGERGSEPGQFRVPHGIAADDQGRIYVADRSNNRIQVFESDGTFVQQITLADLRRQAPLPADYAPNIPSFGQLPDGSYNSLWPNSICITPGPDPVMFTQDMFPGRIYKMSLDGTVLGYLARDGQAIGQFGWIHGLACPSANELYIAELLTWRVQKVTIRD